MIIDKNDPALRFIRCWDRDDEPQRITAIDLSTQIGYWQGQAIPVARYAFVAPTEDVYEALLEYLGPRYGKRVYLKGKVPGKKQPQRPRGVGINPGGDPMPNFIRVGDGD